MLRPEQARAQQKFKAVAEQDHENTSEQDRRRVLFHSDSDASTSCCLERTEGCGKDPNIVLGVGRDRIPTEVNGSWHAERGEEKQGPAQGREGCDARPTVAAPGPTVRRMYITRSHHGATEGCPGRARRSLDDIDGRQVASTGRALEMEWYRKMKCVREKTRRRVLREDQEAAHQGEVGWSKRE